MSLPDLGESIPVSFTQSVVFPTARITDLTQSTVTLGSVFDGFDLGAEVCFPTADADLHAEVVARSEGCATAVFEGRVGGVSVGDPAVSAGTIRIAPSAAWLGRVIDSKGRPLDDKPLIRGTLSRSLEADAPDHSRADFGDRLLTGLAVFDTLLPIVEGQRIGVFSGAGVGKSTLIGTFASHLSADVVVVALVGERGREVGAFLRTILGERGLGRSIVVVETSDKPALSRRRVIATAVTVAEHFRDAGCRVLLMVDSMTRVAEAHREVATSLGEVPAFRGHPPSLVPLLAGLVERTGTAAAGRGSITAIFTVLVAGSDFDEPVADTMRGLLDGHIILSRRIAEEGRFPAVDILKSVSRALPACAEAGENALISNVRRDLALLESSAVMRRSGLYAEGGDPALDLAIQRSAQLTAFLSARSESTISEGFVTLASLYAEGALPAEATGIESPSIGADVEYTALN